MNKSAQELIALNELKKLICKDLREVKSRGEIMDMASEIAKDKPEQMTTSLKLTMEMGIQIRDMQMGILEETLKKVDDEIATYNEMFKSNSETNA